MPIDYNLIDRCLPEGATIYPEYSGRGMYGAKCFGIVFEQYSEPAFFWVYLGQEDSDTAQELATAACHDGMGLGTIIYFPGFNLDNVPDEDEDEDEDEDDSEE